MAEVLLVAELLALASLSICANAEGWPFLAAFEEELPRLLLASWLASVD